jgi:hypothetical protein
VNTPDPVWAGRLLAAVKAWKEKEEQDAKTDSDHSVESSDAGVTDQGSVVIPDTVGT